MQGQVPEAGDGPGVSEATRPYPKGMAPSWAPPVWPEPPVASACREVASQRDPIPDRKATREPRAQGAAAAPSVSEEHAVQGTGSCRRPSPGPCCPLSAVPPERPA